MTNKVQIQGEFVVTQHKRNITTLQALKKFFKCGAVTKNNNDIYHYRVKNVKHLLEIIVPFFEKYPLKTSKRFEVLIFKELCSILKSKEHLNVENYNHIENLVDKLHQLKKMENLDD